MLLLLACQTPSTEALTCSGDVTTAFSPVTEPDPRVEGDEAWVAEDGADVTVTGTDMAMTGQGGAMLTALVDRGIAYTLTAEIGGEGVGRVEFRHILDNGRTDVLASQDFDGPTSISIEATPTLNGDVVGIGVVLLTPGAITVKDPQLTGTRWAEVDASPSAAAPVSLGFLIHIEDDNALLTDAVKWQRRASIFEGLSQTLHAHGARLTLQPDISFIRAAMEHSPDWIADRQAEGMAFSVHLHDESDGAEAFEAAARDANRGYVDAGLAVEDFNGGFASGVWTTLAGIGLSSVTAFKDADTQAGLPEPHVQPWRLGPGVSSADIDAFTTHDPEGPMVYLPGDANREPDHRKFPDYGRRSLSQVYAATREGYVNTWYFMFHVDGFSDGEADTDEYLASGAFDADLAYYDSFLTEVTDPLVAEGAMAYGTPDTMRDDWLDWEQACAEKQAE